VKKSEIMLQLKNKTLKDIDFEYLVEKELISLNISQKDCKNILATIERDVKFL
jgi:hypothetical protein